MGTLDNFDKFYSKYTGITESVTRIRHNMKPRFKVSIRSKDDISILGSEIGEKFREGISILSESLDKVLREAIEANVWRFRNDTRDIISSGRLLGSQQVNVSGDKIRISYGVPYAGLIHYGGYIKPYSNSSDIRVIYLPPRPWVANVLSGKFSNYEIELIYRDIMARILRRYGI